jgi:hypothetical protein
LIGYLFDEMSNTTETFSSSLLTDEPSYETKPDPTLSVEKSSTEEKLNYLIKLLMNSDEDSKGTSARSKSYSIG